jgi:transposase
VCTHRPLPVAQIAADARHFMQIYATKRLQRPKYRAANTANSNLIRPSANQKGTALPIEQEEKHRLASCQISNESVADI